MTTDHDIQEALEQARRLIQAGVPVFAAPPVEGSPGQYHLPKHWEKTIPSMVNLEKWQPGWALAAVGGHAADFLDVDPRNGGADSFAELKAAGHVPMVLGHAKTPSGGDHYIINPTGVRKATNFMPGLDLQSGGEDGLGRGFVYIAPTVRPSKDPADAGTLRAYRWETTPDVDMIGEYGPAADSSLDGIVARVEAKRSAPRERTTSAAPMIDPADPFVSASQAAGLSFGDRSFTLQEAQDFARPALVRLQEAKVGEIEETANVAAATLSHFVPAFWSADEAFGLLEAALGHTAYDPNGPSNWTAEKFRGVLDGRRPPLDNWKAARKAEAPTLPIVAVEAEAGEESLTVLERLRRRLVTAQDLANSPTPEPLIHGLLDLDTEAWLIGAPGSLKSFVALDLAGHVGRGQEWQGHRVQRRGVLYVAAEGQGGMVLRTRAWMKEHGDMEGVTFLPYPVQVKSNDGQWDALTVLARELEPGLIIIDTQARVSVGLEENSATDMGILVSAVGMLKRATGACVLVIHHTGRNGGDARGSSALDGAQDTELKVVRAEPRSLLKCKVVMDKQKDMAEGEAGGVQLQMKVIDLGTDPHTGRDLSSLVVAPFDPFATEEAVQELEVDMEIWGRIRFPEPWTAQVPGVKANAKVKRRALQVLADHGHLRGLTKAEAHRIITGRWEKPDQKNWDAIWADLTALDLVENTGGERWSLDQVGLERLKTLDESD